MGAGAGRVMERVGGNTFSRGKTVNDRMCVHCRVLSGFEEC